MNTAYLANAHNENEKFLSIISELVNADKSPIFKVTITTPKGTFAAHGTTEDLAIERVCTLAGFAKNPPSEVQQAVKQAEKPATIKIPTKCITCGKPAMETKGIGKNNKRYHATFCSTKERTHTEWYPV